MKRILLMTVLVLAAWPGTGLAAEQPGYSGMARLADNTYLTVNDRKNGRDSGARLGVLTVTEADGLVWYPLHVKDWQDEEKEASDLEACCAVPGRPGEFLLAESGHYQKRFGRIFHARVTRDPECVWRAVVLRALRIYDRALDEKGRTHDGEEVEGLACFRIDERLILVRGERGGKVRAARKLAHLIWGELDLERAQFTKLGEEALVTQSVLGDRDCSDLLIRPEKDGWTVFAVATKDSGNRGPFHSAVYRAGRFETVGEKRALRFVRENTPVVLYQLHGLKVEALAEPPASLADSAFSIGTDDESYGGIWRPLFK